MIAGYEVTDQLALTDVFRLYRGRHGRTGSPVLIKTPVLDPPRSVDIAALRRDSEIAAALPIGCVLPLVALDAHHGFALVIGDPGGAPLPTLIDAGPLELKLALSIGVQIATIIDALHRRGMVHNGIRADAIFCEAGAGHAWIIDFSDATGGGYSQPALVRPTSASRLSYASPEQTGRMNHYADHRTDLYSTGVLLYQLVTGSPPFCATDALEMIHCHVARTPRLPSELQPSVPVAVSNIILKLLAKTPDERYQSALSLRDDLEHCLQQWRARGSIEVFPLARRDLADRFQVSTRLYGREQEIATLIEAFDHSCTGAGAGPSMVLVAGYSGIGKTSLIQQLYRPIVRRGGYFIRGKFDQVVRNIPFGALIQAFRGLVRQLLTENEVRLAVWRDNISRALGPNGGVLCEVIPEIEIIIGKQARPVPLAPTESLNRFQLVFQRFVAALAQPEHPLVVFLDDLQWADAATLSLMQPLLTGREAKCLVLMGAYRDNEIDASHPLTTALASLAAAGVNVQRISLGPLRMSDLASLIGETLGRPSADVELLAQLVLDKTGGNPFFVTQFLKNLHQEGYVKFDYAVGRWVYRMESIHGAPMTDNVIDLMTRKIQRLSDRTQRVLTLAACIGNVFDRQTLAIVSEQSPEQVDVDLQEATAEGLLRRGQRRLGREMSDIAPGDGNRNYAFLHDRVQQAAYALIPPQRKEALHLAVGRQLSASGSATDREEHLFAIVHHLDRGRRLVVHRSERLSLSRLNLEAARKAKSSTAYEGALDYLLVALELTGEECWVSDYALAFAVHLEAAECKYLCGRFEDAEAGLDLLLSRVRSDLDRAQVLNLRLLQYESKSRYQDAIRTGHHALSLCGVDVPEGVRERRQALDAEISAIAARLEGRGIAAVGELPAMTDPMLRMMMKLRTNLHTSCYLSGDRTLTMLNTASMVALSLAHGNCEESAYAYALYAAMHVVPVQNDFAAAYAFGQLALEVNDRFPAPAVRARVMMNLGWAVSLWSRPMSESIAISREAYRLGDDNGMFVEATYARFNECYLSLLCGGDLAAFHDRCAPHVDYARQVGMGHFSVAPQLILQWGMALQGRTVRPTVLTGGDFDEDAFLSRYDGQPLFEMFFCVAKLALLYFFGQYREAREVGVKAECVIRDFPGTIWDQQTVFYNALTLAALYPELTASEREDADRRLQTASVRMRRWAAGAPGNFAVPRLIVDAEVARIRGDDATAIALFEIATALGDGCLQDRALANERFAAFWRARENRKVAALYLREACTQYVRWGAAAKVDALERDHPDLLRGAEQNPVTQARADVGHDARFGLADDASGLDLVSMMKAAQAIAGEFELEKLLERLMRIAIENAGAERGSLLLEHDGEAYIHAEGSLHDAKIRPHEGVPLATAESLPVSLVNFVRRTSEAVVLADAQGDDRYLHDPYMAGRQPRSVMCVPVLKQGTLVGVLYLENNMLCGAFTPERIQMMQMLATDAAISLENARLFAGLKEEIRERRDTAEMLRIALEEVQQLKNELEAENVYLRSDLIANVSHDLRTPLASLRGYLETVLLKENEIAPDERRGYLEIAVRQSEHLASLVDELFELAKLDFKGLRLNVEPVQLGELAADVVQKFQLTAKAKGVNLTVDAPASMPFANADLSLIERALENLIGNALKHTPAGGDVRVTVSPGIDRVVARVSDTGCGIPPAELPYIFERFYRVDKSRNSATGGAGLGLAITKRILELHGSMITVESAPMGGSCFSFCLAVPETAPA